MSNKFDVFISCAADTKPLAEELGRAAAAGVHAWADFKDIQPGQRWKDEIEQALERAREFLILVGPGSRTSQWQVLGESNIRQSRIT